ncbi:hypothetical protein BaRGS_00028357 [Batillaria attramentaria]|uniref:Uncharacterized protein n=1 Tax=Batillaria attramentaria TaxID=370345 RepID=A0ABD0JZU6_9CAEN
MASTWRESRFSSHAGVKASQPERRVGVDSYTHTDTHPDHSTAAVQVRLSLIHVHAHIFTEVTLRTTSFCTCSTSDIAAAVFQQPIESRLASRNFSDSTKARGGTAKATQVGLSASFIGCRTDRSETTSRCQLKYKSGVQAAGLVTTRTLAGIHARLSSNCSARTLRIILTERGWHLAVPFARTGSYKSRHSCRKRPSLDLVLMCPEGSDWSVDTGTFDSGCAMVKQCH